MTKYTAWSKDFRRHFIETFLLAACSVAASAIADKAPSALAWPAYTMQWLFLCAALVASALMGHAASKEKLK